MQKYLKVCNRLQKNLKILKSTQKYLKMCKKYLKYAKVSKSVQHFLKGAICAKLPKNRQKNLKVRKRKEK